MPIKALDVVASLKTILVVMRLIMGQQSVFTENQNSYVKT